MSNQQDTKKKTNKVSKAHEPKRQRYVAEKRGYRRRINDLEGHLEKHPNDKQSEAALPRLRDQWGIPR